MKPCGNNLSNMKQKSFINMVSQIFSNYLPALFFVLLIVSDKITVPYNTNCLLNYISRGLYFLDYGRRTKMQKKLRLGNKTTLLGLGLGFAIK